MGFGEAISSGFRNYVGFSGRAARSEYWYWFLFSVICQVVGDIIDSVLIGSQTPVLGALVGLALLLPGIAVSIRRLHDLDRTGWFLLLVFHSADRRHLASRLVLYEGYRGLQPLRA